ncbi:MAG: AAA family ATPase [Candidatus Baltobacteraceae bacterium]
MVLISAPLYSDEFVGRREELAFLHEEFTAANEAKVRLLLIEGEAGIGKSRLVREFINCISPHAAIAVGSCAEQIRSPYLPMVEILEALDPRGAVLPARLRQDVWLSQDRSAYFEAVADVVRRQTARSPLVLVIEDVQWADNATLELLRFLLQHLRNSRTMMVVTMRTEGVGTNPALAALRSAASRNRCNTLVLRALHRNEIKHMVQETLRKRQLHLDPATLSQIEVLAEGNPLFAEELARVAIESGDLTFQKHMPLSLQALLSERLAPFSEMERRILIHAAIVGETFDVALLAAICSCTNDEVLALIQRAVSAELVREIAGASLRFRFHHALIRQALGDQLVLGLAAPLHVRIAEELESRPDSGERATELAYHWSAARVAGKARYWNEIAAQSAWDVYAYRDAIRFYSAALQWDYPAGVARAAIYKRLGTLLYIDGCGEEPARWFVRCREEYAAAEDAVGVSEALLMLADQGWVDGKTDDSLRAASEAAAQLERLGYKQLYAQAVLSIARFSITLGNATQALAHLRAVARLRRHFDIGMQATFYEVRGETYAMLGKTSLALADFRDAAEFAAQSGISELIAQIENNFALVAVDLGELDLAIERHRVAVEEARRTGMTWRIAYSALNYARTLMLKGDLRAACALVWEALEVGVTTATFKTKAAAIGIPLALMLNDPALLDACADEDALAFSERSREIQRRSSVSAAFAELRSAQGVNGESQELLTRAIRAIPHAHRSWDLFVAIARWGNPEDVALASTILSGATGRPRVQRAFALLFSALTTQRSNLPRSQRLASLAARGFATLGDILHQAYAIELSGRTAEALERYRAMGSVRDIDRLSTQAKPATTMQLTTRQAEIAHLVGQGESNRDVARALHISENTVEHHLSAIFLRLHIKSRAQLAHLIARSPRPI